ncbi:33170_t:CDS:2, partial [Racocetra persica]
MTDISTPYHTTNPPHKEIMEEKTDSSDVRSVQVLSVAYTENDPTTEFFYRPRTLTVLTAMLIGLVYVAMYPEADDTATNIK